MRKSLLLKALLLAAFPMFAVEDEATGAAPSSTGPAADAAADPAADSTAATTQVQIDPPVVVLDTSATAPAVNTSASAVDALAADQIAPETLVTSAGPSDEPAVDAGQSEAAAPIVQTPTPIAQPGGADDPVLETVKTPAHNVAEEIQEQIKKLEQLPAEVAAWFENKFIELAGHIKALL
ncbi:hypothetical protein [Paraburkholderia dipogonis]|uniref:hypothetical protein n=1 Tax=Paraburkholderia dipogonis TaxID=1211383 RepID=UPI0038BBF48A